LDLDGLEAQAPVRLAPSFVDGARVGKKRAAEAEPAAGRRAMVAHAAVYATQPTDKARALEALVQRMARVGVCPEAAPAIEGEGLLAQLERDARARVLSTFDVALSLAIGHPLRGAARGEHSERTCKRGDEWQRSGDSS